MSVRIAIMAEGDTEKAFKQTVREFLKSRCGHNMPKLDFFIYHGRLVKEQYLSRDVQLLLSGRSAADHVVALTDVYTGSDDFRDAADAKRKMRCWVGDEPRFHPHVALHDFEAWLFPYWDRITELSGTTRRRPGIHPERINHQNPPSDRLKDIFRTGAHGRKYGKVRDAMRILDGQDLSIAARACPELKAFLNTILTLAGGTAL